MNRAARLAVISQSILSSPKRHRCCSYYRSSLRT